MDKLILGVIMVVLAMVFYALFTALPVMWLWNWLAPELFGLKTISFFQSLGLCFLCGLLFRSGSSSK